MGETLVWYKLADRQGRSLTETRAWTPSSEFMGWIAYFEWQESQERTKLDYYLAQIAAEIRVFRQMFAKDPKSVSVEDCILTFKADDEGRIQRQKPASSQEKPKTQKEAYDELIATKGVQTGPELMNDPKWAKINADLKARWARRERE